jgi:hypothetical protein
MGMANPPVGSELVRTQAIDHGAERFSDVEVGHVLPEPDWVGRRGQAVAALIGEATSPLLVQGGPAEPKASGEVVVFVHDAECPLTLGPRRFYGDPPRPRHVADGQLW